MDISSKEVSDVVSIGFSGRLDANSAPEAEKAIESFLSSGKKKLVLDLGGLEYISSAGLRVLLIANKGVKQKSGKMALSGLKGNVKEVVEVSGLSPLFTIHETAKDALASLASK
jgi:anti-anti-sigma factor